MKIPLLKQVATTGLMLFAFLLARPASQVFAQNPAEAPPAEAVQEDQTQDWREKLGLTPDQVGKIRSILEEKKLERQAARRRLNQAQRALDQAIYSDDATEAAIEERAREVAEAQAVEVRIRAITELNIRRVLTPEQLNTFRRIRQERVRTQMERRLENGNQQRPLKNERLETSVTPQAQRNAGGGGSPTDGPRGRNANPALGPRERRGLLPRRIRP